MVQHRWVIDSMGEDSAMLETEAGRLVSVPLALLPSGAAEGDVVRVTTAEGDAAHPLEIVADPAATAEALRRSREQVRPRPQNDPGGDITL